MRFAATTGLALVALALAPACGALAQSRGPWIPTAEPRVAQTPDEDATNPSFNLLNASPEAVHSVHVSPSWADDWGDNLLPANRRLAAGRAFPVRLQANGDCLNDVRVAFADGRVEERRDVDTCEAPEGVVVFQGTAAVAAAAMPRRGTTALRKQPTTGLAAADVAAGNPRDLIARGTTPERPAVGIPGRRGGPPTVVLVNNAGRPMVRAYIAPAGGMAINWGDNRIGTIPLDPGRQAVIALPAGGGCRYDVRVVYQDDRTDGRRVDVCRQDQLVLN